MHRMCVLGTLRQGRRIVPALRAVSRAIESAARNSGEGRVVPGGKLRGVVSRLEIRCS